jgi:hypothetical protein
MEEKVVAFIDILGFKELLRRLSGGDEALLEDIKTSLQGLRAFGRLAEEKSFPLRAIALQFPKAQATAFSDNIVLSDEPTNLGVGRLVSQAVIVASMLLDRGILSRGGIVIGPLFHEEGIVFGKGLVDAYELEKSVAVYPRIVVSDEAAEKFDRPLFDRLARDSDGCWYIDVLWSLRQVNWDPRKEGLAGLFKVHSPDSKRFAAVRNTISSGLITELSRAEPRLTVLAKYRWLAHRFNAAVRELNPDGVDVLELR